MHRFVQFLDFRFVQFLDFRDFCSFSTVTNCIELCGAAPDTPPFASYSVHTQTEVEATLAIGFSGKGSIVSLVWLDILDRRPSRRRCCFQCASINLLERENVHRIATKESPCADVIAIQFARCQIKYCKTKRTCY